MANKIEKAFNRLNKKAEKRAKKSKAWRVLMLGVFGLALAAWVGIVLFAVEFGTAFIVTRVMPQEVLGTATFVSAYQAIVYGIALFIIIFVPWKVLNKKTTRDEMGLRGLPTWTDILLAPIGLIAAMFAAAALTALMMVIMPGIDWEQAQNVGYTRQSLYLAGDFILAFVCLVVLAPICEEIIFRGWLYGKLRFRMSAAPAILITSVLFGVMHRQWNVGVTVFAMSIGMCIMRELTGTIWGGVIMHMIKNGLAFYFLFVAL